MRQRILITGGAGFLGSNLSKRLLADGYDVVAVDNFITGPRSNLDYLTIHPNFKFIKWDITKPLTSNSKLRTEKFEQIYHLACPTGVENLGPLAEKMILACSMGTKNVLDFALKNKAKVLFSSSSEVYGDPLIFPQKEEYTGNVDATGFRSPYEEGKRFSESLIMMYVRKNNLDAKIVRVFNTYGPYMSSSDSRVIPRFLNQVNAGLPLTVHGNGRQMRTFCYVDDLVSGFVIAMRKVKAGEVYNLGGESEISIIRLANLILKITGSNSAIKFIRRPPHDHQRRMPDLVKIKKLGWSPNIDLAGGLKKTIDFYNRRKK